MAERCVGLDITDESICAVEVANGLITARGEVALPDGAVTGGEVMDPTAVTAAIRRLWKISKFATRRTVLGAPSEQVVARQADLPDLTPAELRDALRFEVGGMIPFPISECILDCTEIERETPKSGPGTARVLVTAVHQPSLAKWIAAAQSARLQLMAVDHWAYALVRAAGPNPRWPEETELVIDIGPDALAVLIHTAGVVRFARSLTGFSQASEVSVELEDALARIEQFRLQGESGGTTTVVEQTTIRHDPIVDAVRSTLDYLTFQPGTVHVEGIRLSGDLDRAGQLVGPLVNTVGLPVSVLPPLLDDPAVPRHGERIHPERDLLAFGHALALTKDHFGPKVLDLLNAADRFDPKARRNRAAMTGGALVAVGLMTALTMTQRQEASEEKAALSQAKAQLAAARGRLVPKNPAEIELTGLNTQRTALLAGDVDWPRVLTAVIAASPPDAPLVALEAHRTLGPSSGATPAGAAAAPAGLGSLTVTVQGGSQSASANWLTALGRVAELTRPVPGASTSVNGGASGTGAITATISATLSSNAASTRATGGTTNAKATTPPTNSAPQGAAPTAASTPAGTPGAKA